MKTQYLLNFALFLARHKLPTFGEVPAWLYRHTDARYLTAKNAI